jgi:hypothetical protein
MTEPKSAAFWAVVELMRHCRLAGMASEETIAGAAFLRLDIPSTPPVTQFYSASAVYCITPTTEDIAHAATRSPVPVSPYELPGWRRDEPDPDPDDSTEVDAEPWTAKGRTYRSGRYDPPRGRDLDPPPPTAPRPRRRARLVAAPRPGRPRPHRLDRHRARR